ncbi:hypothetical protein BOTBODRAFT_176060 [Botryobasidium botryosum FD-172 SS1]|uniref:Uncharacterized protein n=1 Tax=Botryobasidium botryosum (strain FD-172 SS1) TaxID=930990 RepID=A0A067MBJ5_BOTB1|nr:hypothetical protein BOTBODRAFT_176060 [Botryobasidium botryosum FD-172 SS1]
MQRPAASASHHHYVHPCQYPQAHNIAKHRVDGYEWSPPSSSMRGHMPAKPHPLVPPAAAPFHIHPTSFSVTPNPLSLSQPSAPVLVYIPGHLSLIPRTL